MNKRGLSDVVVTVLIILIVIVALGVIAAIVLPLLRDSGKQVGTEKFTTNVEIVPKFTAGDGQCVLEFDINRPTGAGNITALRFVLTNTTGGTKTVDYPNAPTNPPFTFGQLEVKHIVLDCTPLNNVASVSVAPIFSNGVGLISDTRPVPASVCGNGVVELGEQCDGTTGRCMTTGSVQYLGTGTCNSCLISGCNANNLCSNGFDDDLEGGCDFRQYTSTCAPWPVNNPNSNLFEDIGCASPNDNDETPADWNILVSPANGEQYSVSGFPNFDVGLSIILNSISNSTTNAQIAKCWYEWRQTSNPSINSGGNISLSECSLGSNNQQISLPALGSYNLIAYANDSTGDFRRVDTTFNLVSSTLQIHTPFSNVFWIYSPQSYFPFEFSFDTSVSSGTCSYSVTQGVQQPTTWTAISCNQGNGPLSVSSDGAYTFYLRVIPTTGQTSQQSVQFSYATRPGDMNGDRTVDFLDQNFVLGYFGCPNNPSQGISCTGNWQSGDVNFDGVVDQDDLNFVLGLFGTNY